MNSVKIEGYKISIQKSIVHVPCSWIEIINIINDIKLKLTSFKTENNEFKYNYFINELDEKITNIYASKKLTILDATKSNLTNYEVEAIKQLIANSGNKNSSKITIISKNDILDSKLVNKDNLVEYVEEIKERLIKLLENNDEINIL